jgi:hypothetical protein
MNGGLYKHITKRLHFRFDPLSQGPESSSPERTEEHSLFIKQNAKRVLAISAVQFAPETINHSYMVILNIKRYDCCAHRP